jgi:hypothetical protein
MKKEVPRSSEEYFPDASLRSTSLGAGPLPTERATDRPGPAVVSAQAPAWRRCAREKSSAASVLSSIVRAIPIVSSAGWDLVASAGLATSHPQVMRLDAILIGMTDGSNQTDPSRHRGTLSGCDRLCSAKRSCFVSNGLCGLGTGNDPRRSAHHPGGRCVWLAKRSCESPEEL